MEFEEINIIEKEYRRSIPFDEYFDEMDLGEEEKEERKEFAEKMNEIILFIFSLYILMKKSNAFDIEYIIWQLEIRYSYLIKEDVGLDEYLEEYVRKFAKNTIDTTISHEAEEYYLSDDRAVLISENEAVTVYSHSDYMTAVNDGKTTKTWVTEKDKRVRETHKRLMKRQYQ